MIPTDADADDALTEEQQDGLGAVPLLSPRDASALALRRVIETRFVARVDGRTAPDRTVRFARVWEQFPTVLDRAVYPVCSIADVGRVTDDDADLGWDDDGYDDDAGRALAGLEVSGSFAVDMWAVDPVERLALKAAFPRLFRAGAADGGPGSRAIWVDYPTEALPRGFEARASSLRIRLSLDESPTDVEEAIAAQESEYRATARVTWDAASLSAERVAQIRHLVQSGDVVDVGTFAAEAAERDPDGDGAE
jgi:hypothetical protein